MFRAETDLLPTAPAQALEWAAEHLQRVGYLHTGDLYVPGTRIIASPTTMLGALDVACGNARTRSGVAYDWPAGAAVKRAALGALSDQLTRNGVMPVLADADEDTQRRDQVARWEHSNAMTTGRAVDALQTASESSALPLYPLQVRLTGPTAELMLLTAADHLEKVGLWLDADGVHACDPAQLSFRSPATLLYAFDRGASAYGPDASDDSEAWESLHAAAATALAALARTVSRCTVDAVPPHLQNSVSLTGYHRLQVRRWSCGPLAYPNAATDRALELLRSAARGVAAVTVD